MGAAFPKNNSEKFDKNRIDHNSLILDNGSNLRGTSKKFRFEVAWSTQENFKERTISKWPQSGLMEIQDYWKVMKILLRKFLKGWGANICSQMNRDKYFL